MINDIEMITSNDVWAVGSQPEGGRARGFVVHYDGVTWERIPVPPQGQLDDELASVAAVAPDDVWIVGFKANRDGPDHKTLEALILHWDGERLLPVAAPGDSRNYFLTTATANESGLVIAGGDQQDTFLVWRFGGSRWQKIDGPESMPREIAIDGDDLYVFGGFPGNHLVQRWHAGSWTTLGKFRNEALTSFAFASPTNMWVAGGHAILDGYEAVLKRWDGTRWRSEPFTTEGSAMVTDIAAISVTDAYAVGHTGSSDLKDYPKRAPLLLRWDGRRWHNEKTSVNATAEIDSTAGGSIITIGTAVEKAPLDWALATGRVFMLRRC